MFKYCVVDNRFTCIIFRDEVEISADSSSHVTPLTDSEIEKDGDDMDLSEVTSITPVSGLTNQLTGQGLPLHPV